MTHETKIIDDGIRIGEFYKNVCQNSPKFCANALTSEQRKKKWKVKQDWKSICRNNPNTCANALCEQYCKEDYKEDKDKNLCIKGARRFISNQ